MGKTIATFALLLPLTAAPLRAAGPSEDFRAEFKPYEQWMLDAVLNDPKQKAAFDADAVAAANGGDDAANAIMKWRKTLVAFSTQFKTHLDTVDIIPNAQSVEQMVDQNEFNITQYYWLRKPAKEREAVLKDIATGNNILPYGGRKLVEAKARKGRLQFSSDLGDYLNDPDVVKAAAWTPPAPKPVVAPPPVTVTNPPAKKPGKKPAPTTDPAPKPTVAPEADPTVRAQLEAAARDGNNAAGNTTNEGSSENAGSNFTGSGEHAPPPPAPVAVGGAPVPNLVGPALGPSTGETQGGFVITAPPNPVLDQSKPRSEGGSKLKVWALKYGPKVAGGLLFGLLFGILGALFGGPLIGVVATLAGVAVGTKAGDWAGKKLLHSN